MYREHFGLSRRPFELTPDPGFLYMGEAHREGLATLVYAVESGKGFVLLTGEVGTGKTTLLHALLQQLDHNTASAFLFNPRLEPLDFFRVLFEELGIETVCTSKAEYLLALNRFLIERLEHGMQTLLIVDEAQNLSPEMLEEIRLLSNLETPTSKLIQIMLVGQPELAELLSRPELRQLRQRIALRHNLVPFDEAETARYVHERLIKAGASSGDAIFDKRAMRAIYRFTEGIPRLINSLCDSALLLAYSRQEKRVGEDEIEEAAFELELRPTDEDEQGRPDGGRRAAPGPKKRRRGLSRFLGLGR